MQIKKINLWDFPTRKVIATFKGHTLAVTALACYQTLLASASADSTVKLWTLATNELICTLWELLSNGGRRSLYSSMAYYFLAASKHFIGSSLGDFGYSFL